MVQVDEISFSEQPGDFRFGIIDWLVGINAYDYLFLCLSPLVDLLNEIGYKCILRIGKCMTLLLEQAGLLCCSGVQCRIKLLVTW